MNTDNLDPATEPENPSPEIEEAVTETQDIDSWTSSLDDDLRENPSLTKFKDLNSLGKSYVELQKMIGKDKVVIPGDDASDEEKAKFYEKLGRPDDLTAYTAPESDDIPDDIKIRPESEEQFRQKAFELGLTNKQFQELYALQQNLNLNQYNQMKEDFEKLSQNTETALRQEWGSAYSKKVDGAQQVINSFFKNKGIHKAFDTLSSDKGFVMAMAEIADKLGEDVIAGTGRTAMTPTEARSEYNKMLMDKDGPLLNELHPEHDMAVQRATDLTHMMEAGA